MYVAHSRRRLRRGADCFQHEYQIFSVQELQRSWDDHISVSKSFFFDILRG